MQPDQTTDTSPMPPDTQPPMVEAPAPTEPAATDESVIDQSADDLEPMGGVSWEASQFVDHQRDMGWFIGVIIAGVVLIALSIWLQAWTFTALVVVMVGAVIFLAIRPPQVMHYQLTGSGIHINDSQYRYNDFRAFGVVQEDALYYISLIPVKRFMPAIEVYFPQEHGEQIVDMIGAHVPMQTIKPDFIDRVMRHLRF